MEIQTNLNILKTYKLYINGAFVRSESGRHKTIKLTHNKGFSYNACWASRKDLRNAVEAAIKALEKWKNRSSYNRGQIIYRMAEMLDSRRADFVHLLEALGYKDKQIDIQINTSIDLLVYYTGWSDKYEQIYTNINPNPTHFNLSILEPVGIVGILIPKNQGLVGIIGSLLLSMVGGNTTVLLVDQSLTSLALTFAEVLHTSDIPAGVVNILTTFKDDLLKVLAGHYGFNALVYYDLDVKNIVLLKELAAQNVKIVVDNRKMDWLSSHSLSPSLILDLQEVKTLWHPIMPLDI